MTKTKYIVVTILILLGLLITGELYQSYTDCFSDFYETSFYLQPGGNRDEMLNDIYAAASRHNVSVFFIDSKTENVFSTKISIYGDEKIKNKLISEYDLHEGKCDSFFSGSSTISFYDFMDVPNSIINTSNPKYYLSGNFDDMISMKKELVDQYAGKFPVQDDYSTRGEMQTAVFMIWIIIGLVICFVSFYYLTISQREFMVRITMGERSMKLYLKNIILDSLFMASIFIVAYFILSHYTNVSFMSNISIPIFIVVIIFNILVNLKIFFFRIKKLFSKTAGHHELILGTYLIKIFSCCAAILLITFQLSAVYEYIQLYKQKDFFKSLQDYHYVQLQITDDINNIDEQLFRCFDNRLIISDPCIDYSMDEDTNNKTALLINSTMLDKIIQWIPELSDIEISKNGCIIVPQNADLSKYEYEYLKDCAKEYSYDKDNESSNNVQVIKYADSASVIAVEENFINYSSWIKNPVIIVITVDDYLPLTENQIQNNKNSIYIRPYNLMINASSQELNEFAEKYNCKAEITNVYDYYKYRLIVMKRSMYLSVIFITMILLLEIGINILIVNLEYRFNSIELALKKILSYSKFERMKRLCVTTGVIIIISTLVCIIILKFMNFDYALFSIISAILTTFLNYFVIMYCTAKFEKTNIPKILKGGVI